MMEHVRRSLSAATIGGRSRHAQCPSTSCPQSPQVLPATAKRASMLATPSAVPVGPCGQVVSIRRRARGPMRGPVTGVVLALGLRRCEAARVTSERKRGSDAGGEPRYHAALAPNFVMTRE